jgi:hypothetical protein
MIISCGLPKTGTSSLNQVLSQAGVKMWSNPYDIKLAEQFMRGDFKIDKEGLGEMPASAYWEEIRTVHPDAKFIYTTREIESWLESCKHWWNDRLQIRGHIVTDRHLNLSPPQMTALSFFKLSLFGTYLYNEDRFRHVYRKHVASAVADENFLILPLELPDEEKCRLLENFLDIEIGSYAVANARNK